MTIEAKIKNGKIIPLEPDKLPRSGRLLLTILPEVSKKPDWRRIKTMLGRLETETDPGEWQSKLRDDWNHRI